MHSSTGGGPGEGGLVLVVDDDELIRRSVGALLVRLGWSVAVVSNGRMAVELVKARPWRFSAVLLDLLMPGMHGREVFHALTAIRPDLPVVICSGYAEAEDLDDVMRRSCGAILQKPFTADALASALLAVGAVPAPPSAGPARPGD